MQQSQGTWQQPPSTTTPKGGNVALQYGLLFGGIISLIDILYTYMVTTTSPLNVWMGNISQSLSTLPMVLFNTIDNFIFYLPIYILLFIAFLLAGLFAVRKTKQTTTGAMTGLIVGGVYLLVDIFIVNILMNYLVVFPQMAHYGPVLPAIENSILTTDIVYGVVADLIMIGIGALIGMLGGVIGKGGNPPTQNYSSFPPYPPSHQAQWPTYPNPYDQPSQSPPPPPISGQ